MPFTEIVKRALVYTVTDIGQLTAQEKRELNAAVKRGHLSRGKGGPFPVLKTVWACPGFDYEASRRRYVDRAMALCELDRLAAEERRQRTGSENDDIGSKAGERRQNEPQDALRAGNGVTDGN